MLLFINGKRRDSTSTERFDDVNPATGKAICSVPETTPAELDEAIANAAEAQRAWGERPGAERGRILAAIAARLRKDNDRLAAIEVEDTGKPISEANVVDVASAADAIEYYAGLASKLHGDHYDLPPSAFAYTRREPLGVCAGIGAWNYPLQIAAWKAAPALACGNSMVFKPSELTPRTAVELAAIAVEEGLPPGVLNVVQGGAKAGQHLTGHDGIAKVSFTGEVTTGARVMADAAGTLKRVTMELGGKSPLLIMDDADVDAAVSGALLANFYTQGEICTNGTRVFVHEAIHDRFLEALLPRVEKMVVGDPMDPATHVGALISEEHLERVLGYVASGVEEGARLAIGGTRVDGPGAFMKPAVFTECTDDMRIVREEIFGPVMSVLRFADEDEAIRRANATPYGLASGVFTKDVKRAHRIAQRLDAGTCWINNYNVAPIEMPFGGFKRSGIGYENSLVTIEQYTRLKTVYVELGEVIAPY